MLEAFLNTYDGWSDNFVKHSIFQLCHFDQITSMLEFNTNLLRKLTPEISPVHAAQCLCVFNESRSTHKTSEQDELNKVEDQFHS